MYEKENKIIEIMKDNKIDIVATLPCDKAKNLFHLIPQHFCNIPLNKEEDGIGICAGACLAGGKPIILMQSSGLGNCFNALLSLTSTYKLPLPIIASWRGIYKEKIPAQIPFNKNLPKILKAHDIPCTIIDEGSKINLIEAVIRDAYKNNRIHVALISPKTWENEKEEKSEAAEQVFPKRERKSIMEYEKTIREPEMTRYDAIQTIAEHLDREAVVSNIGIPGKELYNIKDRPLNFYMLGSYSQASPIGLGISLKTRRNVFVLDGDGSLLGTGILPTIASAKPKNLSVICLDNGTFGSTGNQLTEAYSQVDMELYAKSMGMENTVKAQNKKELKDALENLHDGPNFIHVIIKPKNAQVKNIPLAPAEIKERFINSI